MRTPPVIFSLLVPLALACAPLRETRTETVVAQRWAVLEQRRAPEHDRFDVSLRVENRVVVAQVAAEHACHLVEATQRLVREDVERYPSKPVFIAEAVTAGLGALFTILLLGSKYDTDAPQDRNSGVPDLRVVSAGMFGIAGLTTAADATRFEKKSTTKLQTDAPAQERVGPCEPGTRIQPDLVVLSAPGFSISAPVDSTGAARIPLPADVPAGQELSFDVFVNGRLMSKARVVP